MRWQRKQTVEKSYGREPHVRLDEGKLGKKRDGKAISFFVSVFYSKYMLW